MVLAGVLAAQGTIYLRAPGPAGLPITITDASNTNPIVIATATPHRFVADELIHIYLVDGNRAANGIWKVKAIIDPTHFSIMTLDGLEVAGSGAFRARGSRLLAGFIPSTVERVKGYILKPHPRVLLDGPDGPLASAIKSPAYATTSNPAWKGLVNSANQWESSNWTNNIAATGLTISPSGASTAAIKWLATGDSAAHDTAINTLQQVERMTYGTIACDEAAAQCGYPPITDYPSLNLFDFAQAYSIMWSELTPVQRKTIADKMLNDLGDNCTKNIPVSGRGTITTSNNSTAVVGDADTRFTAELAPGMFIWAGPTTKIPLQIASIQDDQHLTLAYSYNAIVGTNYAYKYSLGGWTPGQCGLLWVNKHHGYALSDPIDYPPSGGQTTGVMSNIPILKATSQIFLGLALASDDWRAVVLLADSYSWLYDYGYPYFRDWYTGHSSAGNHYTSSRTGWDIVSAVIALQNSIVNGPDLSTGVYLERHLPMWYTHWMPWSPNTPVNFGEPNAGYWSMVGGMRGMVATSWLYRNTDDASRLNYWLDQQSGFEAAELSKSSSDYKMWYYFFLDPHRADLDLNTAPTQYLFRGTDDAMCTNEGWTCDPSKQLAAAISRTGYHSSSDSVVYLDAHVSQYFDHDGQGDPGGYRIYRNVPLLTGDGAALNSVAPASNTIELGGTNNLVPAAHNYFRNAAIIRWAGADPTGDSQSRYTYAEVELNDAYKSTIGATRVQRHLAHLKKPGTQDFVIVYDDVATSTPGMKRAYLHFRKSPNSTFSFMAPDTVLTAANARLLTRVLAPAGPNSIAVYTDNADGSYPGGSGYSYRVSICGSDDGSTCSTQDTESEWLVVHEPLASPGGTLPPTTLLTTAPGLTGVQIGGDDPKVAVFARGGALYSSAGFATSFNGSAQLLVTGLAPGNYMVTRDGAPLVSGVTVNDNDNTLYFESSSGTFQITQISPPQPLAITPLTLPHGVSGIPYVGQLNASGGVPPYFWSIVGGSVPDGLMLTSDGILQGTPTVSTQYTFSIQVQDSARPSSKAQAPAVLTIDPAPPLGLQITVDGITATSAIAHYGVPGLDANQWCGVQLSTDSSFSTLVEQYTDAGGPAMRDYVFGESVPLTENTTYYASATCGLSTAFTQFTTLAANL